ncbi:MAG: hypothetical protein MJB57_14480 [Gemmatimonadetes bacterium]|nr:hypothetical protein [Gemmatimonadota bacterium]
MRRRSNVRAATRAYVQGRDRVWDPRAKLDAQDGSPAGSTPPAEELSVEFGTIPEAPRFGVDVAEHLDFRRGPAAWRDRERGGPTDG